MSPSLYRTDFMPIQSTEIIFHRSTPVVSYEKIIVCSPCTFFSIIERCLWRYLAALCNDFHQKAKQWRVAALLLLARISSGIPIRRSTHRTFTPRRITSHTDSPELTRTIQGCRIRCRSCNECARKPCHKRNRESTPLSAATGLLNSISLHAVVTTGFRSSSVVLKHATKLSENPQ